MFSHVFNQLAAYAEDQLDAPKRSRVDRHLTHCKQCRSALEDIRRGISLASTLHAEAMPDDVSRRIRSSMGTHPIAPLDALWWRPLRFALPALPSLVLATGLYWHLNRPWIRLEAAAAAPTAFEQQGRELHDRINAGAAPLAFTAADEHALWQWLASQGAPVTSMAISRRDPTSAQFAPQGAAIHTLGGARTSVLSFRIDGRPVTLALARAQDVPEAPSPGWWSKRVTHRREPGGLNTLTWTVGGGTYVMVSELDGAGQQACTICHTSPRFTNALRRLSNPGGVNRQ
jgi:anti-sigma factor RsiW